MHRSFPLQGRRLRPCFLDAHPNGRAGGGRWGCIYTGVDTMLRIALTPAYKKRKTRDAGLDSSSKNFSLLQHCLNGFV